MKLTAIETKVLSTILGYKAIEIRNKQLYIEANMEAVLYGLYSDTERFFKYEKLVNIS